MSKKYISVFMPFSRFNSDSVGKISCYAFSKFPLSSMIARSRINRNIINLLAWIRLIHLVFHIHLSSKWKNSRFYKMIIHYWLKYFRFKFEKGISKTHFIAFLKDHRATVWFRKPFYKKAYLHWCICIIFY